MSFNGETHQSMTPALGSLWELLVEKAELIFGSILESWTPTSRKHRYPYACRAVALSTSGKASSGLTSPHWEPQIQGELPPVLSTMLGHPRPCLAPQSHAKPPLTFCLGFFSFFLRFLYLFFLPCGITDSVSPRAIAPLAPYRPQNNCSLEPDERDPAEMQPQEKEAKSFALTLPKALCLCTSADPWPLLVCPPFSLMLIMLL